MASSLKVFKSDNVQFNPANDSCTWSSVKLFGPFVPELFPSGPFRDYCLPVIFLGGKSAIATPGEVIWKPK